MNLKTIKSWNPFAFLTKPPLTDTQILKYDLSLLLSEITQEIHELEITKIQLIHQKNGLVASLKYLEK